MIAAPIRKKNPRGLFRKNLPKEGKKKANTEKEPKKKTKKMKNLAAYMVQKARHTPFRSIPDCPNSRKDKRKQRKKGAHYLKEPANDKRKETGQRLYFRIKTCINKQGKKYKEEKKTRSPRWDVGKNFPSRKKKAKTEPGGGKKNNTIRKSSESI